MTAVPASHIRRNCLLPLLLTVLVFVVSHGICASNFATLPEAGVSKLQAAKQHSLIVIKAQTKNQSRTAKAAPSFDVGCKFEVIDRLGFPLPAVSAELPAAVSAPDSTFPARAPPVHKLS